MLYRPLTLFCLICTTALLALSQAQAREIIVYQYEDATQTATTTWQLRPTMVNLPETTPEQLTQAIFDHLAKQKKPVYGKASYKNGTLTLDPQKAAFASVVLAEIGATLDAASIKSPTVLLNNEKLTLPKISEMPHLALIVPVWTAFELATSTPDINAFVDLNGKILSLTTFKASLANEKGPWKQAYKNALLSENNFRSCQALSALEQSPLKQHEIKRLLLPLYKRKGKALLCVINASKNIDDTQINREMTAALAGDDALAVATLLTQSTLPNRRTQATHIILKLANITTMRQLISQMDTPALQDVDTMVSASITQKERFFTDDKLVAIIDNLANKSQQKSLLAALKADHIPIATMQRLLATARPHLNDTTLPAYQRALLIFDDSHHADITLAQLTPKPQNSALITALPNIDDAARRTQILYALWQDDPNIDTLTAAIAIEGLADRVRELQAQIQTGDNIEILKKASHSQQLNERFALALALLDGKDNLDDLRLKLLHDKLAAVSSAAAFTIAARADKRLVRQMVSTLNRQVASSKAATLIALAHLIDEKNGQIIMSALSDGLFDENRDVINAAMTALTTVAAKAPANIADQALAALALKVRDRDPNLRQRSFAALLLSRQESAKELIAQTVLTSPHAKAFVAIICADASAYAKDILAMLNSQSQQLKADAKEELQKCQ